MVVGHAIVFAGFRTLKAEGLQNDPLAIRFIHTLKSKQSSDVLGFDSGYLSEFQLPDAADIVLAYYRGSAD